MRIRMSLTLAFLLFTSAAFAGPLEEGKEAFNRHNYQDALKKLQPLADQGNPEAQYRIGLMFEQGWGVQQDFTVAMKWLGKSADQGISWAQYHIGFMYANGLGVPQDKTEADKWYAKAKADGNNLAQYEYVEPPPHGSLPSNGVIPNQDTAVQVGKAILTPIYGKEKVEQEEPFTAILDGDVWTVTGHFSGEKNTLGGVATIKLSKSKGTVFFINHEM